MAVKLDPALDSYNLVGFSKHTLLSNTQNLVVLGKDWGQVIIHNESPSLVTWVIIYIRKEQQFPGSPGI